MILASLTIILNYHVRRSQWPRGLRRGLESRLGHGCLPVVSVVCFHVEVFRRANHSSWGVLPTAVRRCVWSRSLVMRRPWPNRGCYKKIMPNLSLFTWIPINSCRSFNNLVTTWIKNNSSNQTSRMVTAEHMTQYSLLQPYAEFLKLRSQILRLLIQAESYSFLVVLNVEAAVF
jgi:hypothetical protein